MSNPNAAINLDTHNRILQCVGEWTVSGIETLTSQMQKLGTIAPATISGKDITRMDSTGAWVLYQYLQTLEQRGKTAELADFAEDHLSLINLIKEKGKKASQVISTPAKIPWLAKVGIFTMTGFKEGIDFLSFLGEFIITALNNLRRPAHIQWRSFFNAIDETGFAALFIVALLNFLIGVVLAYQMGNQLLAYGANVYIVSLLGIGVLQEFAPLITAIIVASRTSSAFTAQLGTMLVNEEIDALRTMGLSPMNRLVLPKIFGLMVSLPLLIIWADIFGLLGGMIVSKRMLGINFYNFLTQFPRVIQISTFFHGLVKAPAFALIIAGIGCFQGFRVQYTADSIGRQTTKSVVQAIFLIIVADAIFSLILPWQNI
ncbi:MAG TPA: ABC transporter permease [Gammaproteobacteria bacterium]|nr:ABC transporter permease [Gammaproteobacteria bacterium]